MNGFRTRIFELHDLPGGLCTAWDRKEYIFDGCINYLVGSGASQPFNQVWQELGALREIEIIHHAEFMRIVAPDGKTLIVYVDPGRLEQEMVRQFPDDAWQIKRCTRTIQQFTRFDMARLQQKPRSLMGPLDWMRLGWTMLPFAPALLRYGFISTVDLAERMHDPFLRRAVPLMFAWPEIPVMAGQALLAYMHTGNAGFPAGASLEFAQALERRYLELGGEIHYKSQVEKILVENDMAVGVRLYNDEVYKANIVISAADGRGTIFDMLDGMYANRAIRQLYDGHHTVYPQIQVSLGVARDLSGEPHWVEYLLDKPLLIAGQERSHVGIKHYCFAPRLAPPGKSVIASLLPTTYSYWQHIYGHKLYDTEQEQVADILIDFLGGIYPGIKSQIEVIDVATPLSHERYTGNWQGSNCGWLLTKGIMPLMLRGVRKTLPGLKNFYMAGQWVEPGGMVSVVAMSGRNAIQMICHAEGKPFMTSTV